MQAPDCIGNIFYLVVAVVVVVLHPYVSFKEFELELIIDTMVLVLISVCDNLEANYWLLILSLNPKYG